MAGRNLQAPGGSIPMGHQLSTRGDAGLETNGDHGLAALERDQHAQASGGLITQANKVTRLERWEGQGLAQPSGFTKGSRATMRARFTELVRSRCCLAVKPVMRRGRILPRSVMNFLSRSTSL